MGPSPHPSTDAGPDPATDTPFDVLSGKPPQEALKAPIQVDVVILGNEAESVITALSAAIEGASVALIRPTSGWLGGLSTQGGLAYMDLTPEFLSPLFRLFLNKAQVKRVALAPRQAHQILQEFLEEYEVQVFEEHHPQWMTDETGAPTALYLPASQTLIQSATWIDSTPDGDGVVALGATAIAGLDGLFGPEHTALGVTPVFRLDGVPADILCQWEQRLRESLPTLQALLEAALPHHPKNLIAEYVDRNPFYPKDMDYIDILNPAVGVIFHVWHELQQGASIPPNNNPDTPSDFSQWPLSPLGSGSLIPLAATYSQAPVWIDGGNIALLPKGQLAWNGMVTRVPSLIQQLQLSRGSDACPWPNHLGQYLQSFQRFLQCTLQAMGHDTLSPRVSPPPQLYVRHTRVVQTRQWVTANQLTAGGAHSQEAIGTTSYWFDYRGINSWEYFPQDSPLPKPCYNVGLDGALFAEPQWANVAIVSRSGGYSPLAQGACRIIQHLALLGEGVGIAAARAARAGESLHHIPPAEIQTVLHQRNTTLSFPEGFPAPTHSNPLCGLPCMEETQRRQSPLLLIEMEWLSRHTRHAPLKS